MSNTDISPKFAWNLYDAYVAQELTKREATPEAIRYFAEHCDKLTDYAYWFFLSTLWVSYTGLTDIELWKTLFRSSRGSRKRSIMKPSEVKAFDDLPWFVTAFRAHRPGETDWIAYTLSPIVACRFAKERKVDVIKEYRIKKRDIVALFLRRGEVEVIVLDKERVEFKSEWPIVMIGGA